METAHNYCLAFNPDASERVLYNNPPFPAYVRRHFLSAYPDYAAVSHWHEDLEFIVIKKGNLTYNVNGTLIPLAEGSGIMVNSRQLHYGFSAERKECEFICILLSTELLRGSPWFYQNHIARITENADCPFLYLARGTWQESILRRLEHICQSFAPAPDSALPCFELMESFLFIMRTLYENLHMEQSRPAKESSALTALRKMILYIETHYAERITLDALAAAGAVCKSKCSLLFKQYLRETPITYTTRLRLRKSLIPLLDSDRSIMDIAYAHGFGGVSYYCETFRKYYGISPLRYRKKAGNLRPDCAASHRPPPDI